MNEDALCPSCSKPLRDDEIATGRCSSCSIALPAVEQNKSSTLDLINKLEKGEGTLEQAEQWLTRLKEMDPYFYGSDFMLHLETGVKARRKFEEMVAERGMKLSKEELVDLVRKLQNAEGSEEDEDAWLMLIERNVPDPEVSNLIYYPDRCGLGDNPTPEEIIEKALSYRPIILGPATER